MRFPGILFSVAWKLAALLLAYNLVLFVARPEVHLDFDAGTENRILAERYLYGTPPEAVMVGSSLGRTMTRFFPENFYNLSFSGGSAITGAEIVIRADPRPKVVVVETNVMERVRNQEMIDLLFDAQLFPVRRYLPGFRIENRPVLLAANLERLHPDWRLTALRSLATVPEPVSRAAQIDLGPRPAVEAEEDDPRLAAGLASQIDYTARIADKQRAMVATAVADLAGRVDALRAQGVCVLLVRLPIQPQVDASPLERHQAAAVLAALPPQRYSWIHIGNDGTYRTVDGLHLSGPSAQRVAWRISDRVLRILRGTQACEALGA